MANGPSQWLTHDRFGMFNHWGLSAHPARHEWVMNYERLSNEAYEKYFDHFGPDLYDREAWVRAAMDAGMKYVVLTTKHHKGLDFSCKGDARSEVWGAKGRDDWGSGELLTMCRELPPKILVNESLGIPGDSVTPEQCQPSGPLMVDGEELLWEACQTVNGSWGYFRDNDNYTSADLMVRMFVDGVSKNGNLALTVGPTGRGVFEDKAVNSLSQIGKWMRFHSRSIYGAGKVEYAPLLNDASEVFMKEVDPNAVGVNLGVGAQSPGTGTLTLPVVRPEGLVPVVEIFLTDVGTNVPVGPPQPTRSN